MEITNILARHGNLGELVDHRPNFWQRYNIDLPLVLLFIAFAPISLATIYSASSLDTDLITNQLRNFAVALVVMLVVAQFNVYDWRRFALAVYLGCMVMLLLVPWFGVTVNGAQRWLDIGIMRFQPSELMKLALPVVCAWSLAQASLPPQPLQVLICLTIITAPVLLIAQQPDLGTALLVAASGLAALFLSGISFWYISAGVAAAVLMAPIAWNYLLLGYQKKRILTLLNPDLDPLGSGWNILQSKIAIGSGSLVGKGWQEGTQSNLSFLPEGHTDFIFSVFAEEFGFIGVLFLLTLYGSLFARALWLNNQSQQIFGKLLGGSLVVTMFVYVTVNIMMVSGLIPVVGVPLPFVSYGGTSLVSLACILGMIMGLRYR